jgi:hypothetical protein
MLDSYKGRVILMAQQDLLGSDKLNQAYQKINNNFDELYAGVSGGGSATDLADLSDVDLTLPIGNNQALVYDNVANKWENQDIPRDLNALTDVVVTNPQPTQVVQWSGTQWVNSLVTVSELGDASITSLANNQLLKYNTSTSKWENTKANINELGDVTISEFPAPGNLLQYNQMTAKWENVANPTVVSNQVRGLKIMSMMGAI